MEFEDETSFIDFRTDSFQHEWCRIVPHLQRFGRKHFGLQEADVEDLVQQTALSILQRLDNRGTRHFPMTAFIPYVKKTFKCKCIDHLRSKRLPVSLDCREVATVKESSPHEERDAWRSFLEEHLSSLPIRQRLVLQAFLLGKKSTEIASELNISSSTVRSLERFGVAAMKKVFLEQNNE